MLKPLLATLLAALLLPMIVAAATVPPLPKGYTGWTKSERKLVTDKNSLFYGVHYIYADKKALQGYKAGSKFPEGSTIVVDYFNIKAGSDSDGPKNMVVMMRKDKRNKAPASAATRRTRPSGISLSRRSRISSSSPDR
jgi:hypothetical protein